MGFAPTHTSCEVETIAKPWEFLKRFSPTTSARLNSALLARLNLLRRTLAMKLSIQKLCLRSFFVQIQDLVADSLRLKSTRFSCSATGSNLSPKIWLPNEMGAWVGGVFQLETVDEALLVTCYPGIWIVPKPETLNPKP